MTKSERDEVVYRVYAPYHESSESGTYEYGYYTDRTAAWDRAKEAADLFIREVYGSPHGLRVEPGDNHIKIKSGFDTDYIYVREIPLNTPLEKNHVGWT